MAAKQPVYQPTDEEIAAVRAYAQKHGKNWKDDLTTDWLRAGYPGMDANQSACLQRLRNRLGPRWLATFELS